MNYAIRREQPLLNCRRHTLLLPGLKSITGEGRSLLEAYEQRGLLATSCCWLSVVTASAYACFKWIL